MRKVRVWGLAATLALGLAVHSAAAADEDEDKSPSPSWLGRLFGKQKPADSSDKDTAKPIPKKISDEEAAKAEQAREVSDREKLVRAREDYLRREKVLLTLMQLAQQKNDQEMQKKIKALTDRAWSVYLRKTGQIPPPAMTRNEERSEPAVTPSHSGGHSHSSVIEIKGDEQP